jgi:hypothetical protein
MDISSISRKHAFGQANIYSVSDNDVFIVDLYGDQYSINWSTNLSAIEFLALWRYPGAEKARVLLMTSSSRKRFPVGLLGYARHSRSQATGPGSIEGYGYQFFNLMGRKELRDLPTSLVRFWLHDASVAWQVLPTIPDKSVRFDKSGAVVGVASNRFDYEGLQRYFRATATAALVEAAEDLLPRAATGLKYPKVRLSSLAHAAFND